MLPPRFVFSFRRLRLCCVAVVGAVIGTLVLPVPSGADPKPGSSGQTSRTPKATSPAPSKKPPAKTPVKRRSAVSSGIGSGARGPAVVEIQSLLQAARYDIATADGAFGDQTFHAVMGFQKANGLARTGRVNAQTLEALRAGATPEPIVPDGGPDRIEVSLPKQYMAVYRGGELIRILSISSGNGKPFCTLDPETGETGCDTAVTPPGSFRITRRIVGWRESKLGLLYNPLYFNGGIAVHGAPSVPGTPASHGCVRIPMVSADYIPTIAPNGIPVYVSDGVTPLRIISSRIAPADAWPGTDPAATLPPTTLAPGTPTTTTIGGTTSTTGPGASTLPPTTLAGATTTSTPALPTTTTPTPTTTLTPTLVRPLTTTTTIVGIPAS